MGRYGGDALGNHSYPRSRSEEFSMGINHRTTDDSRPVPVARRNGIPLGPPTKYDHYMRQDEKRFSEAD